MDAVDVAVIGAGVVGLSVARALAQQGLETVVLERNAHPGEETTSRNSGVIHSGIYYPTGSLKARMCVRGRTLLYEYCTARDIAHRRCGKIVVAGQSQLAGLQALLAQARANGVEDVELLDGHQVRQLEPEVSCAAGLLSPSTGIIDVHELLLGLVADLELAGGLLALKTNVEKLTAIIDGLVVTTLGGDTRSELQCTWLINCAGLSALDFLHRIDGYPRGRLRKAYYAKGSYFACHGQRPFKRLVYPMPGHAGLGIHATLDMDGSTRFGPDVEWVDRPSFDVDPSRSEVFYDAIREYWPTVPRDALMPAYAGVRPKLVGPGSVAGDFEIESVEAHGVPGLINLLGIESPGLTSSLAIGEFVADMVTSGSTR